MIAGVHSDVLEAAMKKADWISDYHTELVHDYHSMSGEAKTQIELIDGILQDLHKLGEASPEGKQLQATLMYKYWSDTPWEMHTADVNTVKRQHEWSTTIRFSFNVTATEAYTLLHQKAITSKKDIAMTSENLKFLADKLKFGGFGEEIKEQLERKMREGAPEFHLSFATEMNKKPFEAILNFRKSDTSDMYFFNNYHATLERNDGQKAEQTFYLNNGKGITAKEAFNLLDGRAVHKDLVTKEGQPYKAWLQLNPEVRDKNNNAEIKQYHEKYGYDLNVAVSKFAVAELKEPEKAEKLMQSLQKGNIQSVTIEKEGSVQSMFMEADPRFKAVKLYDAQMKLLPKEDISRYQNVREGATVKADQKESVDKKKELSEPKKIDKNVKKAENKSLMLKKREGNKRGLKPA